MHLFNNSPAWEQWPFLHRQSQHKKIGQEMKLTKENTGDKSYRDEAERQRKHNQTKEIMKKHAQTEIYIERATESNNK